jgi:hypothetical protein
LGAVDPAGWIEVLQGLSPGDRVVIAPGKLADLKNEGRRVVSLAQTSDVIVAKRYQP